MTPGIRPTVRCASAAAVLAVLTACGGGGSEATVPATYTVGGTVAGLTGSGLVLQSSGVNLSISSSGAFAFPTPLVNGTPYSVVVQTQPSSPPQVCSVAKDSGTVALGNVTNVAVTCADEYTVGGTVSGLVGSGLTLQLYDFYDHVYDGSPLLILANGTFTLDSAFPAHSFSGYVRLRQQPSSPTQECVVHSGAISIQTTNITDVAVLCSEFSYVVNAADDTVSAYTVDAASGALAAIGAPMAAGNTPHAIVGTRDKSYVFVANAGSNDISAFAANPTTGALTELPGSPFAAGVDPQALALFEGGNGPYLYVANAGSDNLSAFSVNSSTGALALLSTATFATGTGPASIAIDPDGPFIYVANHGGSNDLSAFSINVATGMLTKVAGSPFAAGANPLSLAFGALGKFLYTANSGATNSSVSGFTVDPVSGSLTMLSGSPFPIPVSNDFAADRTGAYLYLTTGSGVMGYRIDATTGMLAALSGFPAAAGVTAYSMKPDPTNQYLYVTNDGSDGVTGFHLDASTGGLTPLNGSPYVAGHLPEGIAAL